MCTVMLNGLRQHWLLAGIVTMGIHCLVASTAMAEEDHLVGYKVKSEGTQPGAGFNMTNQSYVPSAIGLGCELKKPKFLLLQGAKNAGDDTRGGPAGNFLCYKAKCSTGLSLVSGEDQFLGDHALEITKAQLVCAPFVDPTLARFIDNGDGTVTDRQTGLMWEKKQNLDSTPNPADMHDADNQQTWSDATSDPDGTAFVDFLGELNRCQSDGNTITNGFAGHCDWRLPTIAELQTIVDATQGSCGSGSGPCIDPIFGPTQDSAYWSGTTYAGGPASAWHVYFGNGDGEINDKTDGNYVRAVRGGL